VQIDCGMVLRVCVMQPPTLRRKMSYAELDHTLFHEQIPRRPMNIMSRLTITVTLLLIYYHVLLFASVFTETQHGKHDR
jgi:hypothetical protein